VAVLPANLIPGAPSAARKQLAAFEWACLALVTLGYGAAGARMPRPKRYAGVLTTFFVLGLVSDMGRSAARIAGAAGGTLTLALLLNQVVSQRLIGFLGGVSGWFGNEPDPPSEGTQIDTFSRSVGGTGGNLTAPPPASPVSPGGSGGGGGGAW
jgi:hypothetical protein